MNVLYAQGAPVLSSLQQCVSRWQSMQDSTRVYVSNALHDLHMSQTVRTNSSALGVLSAERGRELSAALEGSSETMLAGLRSAVEAFDKIVASLRQLLNDCAAFPVDNIYAVTIRDWVHDCKRMYDVELVHKRLCLATIEETGADAAKETLDRWLKEPYVNKVLAATVLAATASKP